jgi:hypothetical protein
MIFQEPEKKTTRNIEKQQSHRCIYIYNIIQEIINTRKRKKKQ